MASDRDAIKQDLIRQVDRDALVGIACDLVNIPSPTGHELACAQYIHARYRAAGIKLIPQSIEDTRANAIGVIKGRGDGAVLMLNGHMDTSYTGDEQYLPDMPGYKPKAVLDADWIYGLGIYNMKGTLACFLHAAEIVQHAGLDLRGDLMIAAVAGEIEKAPVDRFQGPLYRGGACGTWYAITHGAVADFCVVGEPSGMTLMRAHGGYVWTRITLTGDPMHTVFGKKENNTINNMMKVMQALQSWGDEYEQRTSYLGMPAHVTLSAIEGGWPYRCSRVPVFCSLYVDVRLMPGQSPLVVQREIEAVLRKLEQSDRDLAGLHMESHIFMNQWGSQCAPDELVYRAVEAAHEFVHGKKVEVTAVPFASDACELNAHGIPALNYGATGRTRALSALRHYDQGQSDWNPNQGEHASIDDMVVTTKVYLALIADTLTRTRSELGLCEQRAAHRH
ncbi:MAG: M20/M25/M40 family metallo-hydrolase [Burkholderiales bacterium]|nr:M20/M25/M40 family metallo-hydrolase [Burkholderiales bacterium]